MSADNKNSNRAESLLNFGGASRVPVILQAETAECGQVCIAMIQGHYGFETDLSSLRRRFAISSQGISLKGLMDIAIKAGLSP